MTIPDMNTRSIRRVGDHFTIEPGSVSSRPNKQLCDHCGIKRCKVRGYVKRTPDHTALNVRSCAMFIPVLGFSVLNGLDLDHWNTIRVGAAWYDRLLPGQTVAIFNTRHGRVEREMVVTDRFTGNMKSMVNAHARRNHAILHEIDQGELHEHKAAERLTRILKNAYGTNIAADNRPASVIYLKDKH